ncbi:hypothetical protein SOMG_03570 [Schizosaccharomyces osmophilus]|uniref:Uncharacterized protein n=1 Tax=Schizosaccharomyces osmophilus TaxID=2545709 RepID=A0AAF0AXS0_9SCHI|nr:uncharacterized protein SOMG_03570 [Schizosaccharomyces osmophilus]WBW74074.1 hypothetical protein SOMG_03570 [Schizosaccharomyces osmophilus]
MAIGLLNTLNIVHRFRDYARTKVGCSKVPQIIDRDWESLILGKEIDQFSTEAPGQNPANLFSKNFMNFDFPTSQ